MKEFSWPMDRGCRYVLWKLEGTEAPVPVCSYSFCAKHAIRRLHLW